MKTYDESAIIGLKWAPLHQLEDQTWQRIWKIQLADAQAIDTDFSEIEEALSNHEISVSIAKVDDELHVKVTTLRWGWDDDLIIYSYKMLKTLIERIEGIKAIQNQDRWVQSASRWLGFSASSSLKHYYEAVEQRWKEDLEWQKRNA